MLSFAPPQPEKVTPRSLFADEHRKEINEAVKVGRDGAKLNTKANLGLYQTFRKLKYDALSEEEKKKLEVQAKETNAKNLEECERDGDEETIAQ